MLATEILLPASPCSPIPGSFIESPTSLFPEELDISNRENLLFSEPEDTEETEVTAELFGSNYGTTPGTPYSGHVFWRLPRRIHLVHRLLTRRIHQI